MKNKICCFAGHSKEVINDELKIRLYNKCKDLIENKDITEFWVGDYGAFDNAASKIIRQLKKEYSNIKLILVIPYITKNINDCKDIYYQNYDEILIADIKESTPIKYKIIKCNQYMVDNSDYLVAYVNYSWGGAVKTLEYALKKNITVFNLGVWKKIN